MSENNVLLPQVASALLGKTHKWLLQIHNPGHTLFWCSSDPNFRLGVGDQKPLDWMLQHGIANAGERFRWAISAVAEPALSDADAHKALDLMFPLKDGPVAKVYNPKEVLQCLMNYAERAARMIGLHAAFRGFPEIQPSLPEGLPMPEAVLVAQHGQLLADDEVEYNPKVETGGEKDKHYWYCRALYELLPYKYYQRVVGDPAGIMHYVMAAPESLAGANAVWDLEVAAFASYAPHNLNDKQLLYRVLATDTKDYVDAMLDGSPKKVTQSLMEAGHKLITLCNYARRQPYAEVDIQNETKKQLMRDHFTDALEPITRFAFGDMA